MYSITEISATHKLLKNYLVILWNSQQLCSKRAFQLSPNTADYWNQSKSVFESNKMILNSNENYSNVRINWRLMNFCCRCIAVRPRRIIVDVFHRASYRTARASVSRRRNPPAFISGPSDTRRRVIDIIRCTRARNTWRSIYSHGGACGLRLVCDDRARLGRSRSARSRGIHTSTLFRVRIYRKPSKRQIPLSRMSGASGETAAGYWPGGVVDNRFSLYSPSAHPSVSLPL